MNTLLNRSFFEHEPLALREFVFEKGTGFSDEEYDSDTEDHVAFEINPIDGEHESPFSIGQENFIRKRLTPALAWGLLHDAPFVAAFVQFRRKFRTRSSGN